MGAAMNTGAGTVNTCAECGAGVGAATPLRDKLIMPDACGDGRTLSGRPTGVADPAAVRSR
jgi:hypothetical protein